jgi:hypothetical protein
LHDDFGGKVGELCHDDDGDDDVELLESQEVNGVGGRCILSFAGSFWC